MIFPERYSPTGQSEQGGMGDIIHCIDNHLQRNVVLKLLKPGEDQRRLLDEQKALIKVRSKHVVQLFDVVNIDENGESRKALVLECIRGNQLTPGSYSSDEHYLRSLWQIACGLSEIHAAGVIHRDIKPNNLLVNSDNVIKILDFGLARHEGPEASTVNVIGTPIFMAPELWKREANIAFDRAVDVYAFGITALNLISNKLPQELFDRPPVPAPADSIESLLSGAPKEVIEIIIRCIDSNPERRPEMRDVEALIRRHIVAGQHRALLVMNGNTHEIDAQTPSVNVTCGTLGTMQIHYDGTSFNVGQLSGTVKINNKLATAGSELPACCVIAFGNAKHRKFMTFDVSNPEVTA